MIDLSAVAPEERKIIEARREYQKKWRDANKDKVKEHNRRFYEKKAILSTGATPNNKK